MQLKYAIKIFLFKLEINKIMRKKYILYII